MHHPWAFLARHWCQVALGFRDELAVGLHLGNPLGLGSGQLGTDGLAVQEPLLESHGTHLGPLGPDIMKGNHAFPPVLWVDQDLGRSQHLVVGQPMGSQKLHDGVDLGVYWGCGSHHRLHFMDHFLWHSGHGEQGRPKLVNRNWAVWGRSLFI